MIQRFYRQLKCSLCVETNNPVEYIGVPWTKIQYCPITFWDRPLCTETGRCIDLKPEKRICQ